MKTKELVLSSLCLVHGARRVLMVALCAAGLAAWADGTGTKDDPWKVGAAPDAGCVTASMANYKPLIGGSCLSFWGDGAMKDFTQGGAPWSSAAESVRGVHIYHQVTSIGAFAFAGCPLDRGGVKILAPVKTIGASAFAGCTGLKSVKLPKSVTSIGASAFAGCTGLGAVEIPKAVTAIGEGAFKDCASLSRVSVRAAVPPSIGKDAFPKDNLVAIDVPVESMEAYGQADGWKEYADLFQPVYDLAVMEMARAGVWSTDAISEGRAVTNYCYRPMPATDGFSRTRDADGNVLLVIEKPGLIVTGTTKRERIQLNAESVTLDDLTIDVATNCVVTYRTAPTEVIIGQPMKVKNHNGRIRKVSAQGPVRLYADGARNACIAAGNGGLVIKNNGKLVARANGDVPAIRADGDITIAKAGRLDFRADKAPAIGAKGKLTFASISAGTVLRGGKGGAISAAAALVLPDKEGWSFLGAADADAPATGLLAPVTVRKAAGSDVYTGYVGADVAKAVTFAKMTEVNSPADFFSWGADSADFKHPAAPHGKFLAAPADAMIAEYDARIAKDATDYGARICSAFVRLKKAGENKRFYELAEEYGFTFDNDTMHFTGELIHKKGETPEMNETSAEVCDIVLPLVKKAYEDLDAIPKDWKGSMAVTPDLYPVDEEVYFDCADVFCAKAALAEMLCVLNMVKGFDMTLDSDLLPYTFNSRFPDPENGKRGVKPILDNNPEFFSKVRDQKAATEAGDWWSAAARNLDAWDKAHVKRSDGKQHFFMWDFAKMDDNTVQCYDWLHKHRDGLINLPYWASPFDWTLMNGDTAQFWTLQPLFAGKFLRKHFPDFGVGVKAPWCNEPLLDTLPDSTLCGMFPGVSRTYIYNELTEVARAGDFTDLPPYTDDRASSVHAIWYDNLFNLGFANTGNPAIFAWNTASPIRLDDPEFNVRGVTAVFKGWSFSGYTNGASKATWEGDTIPTPFPKEHTMFKRRNVVATANFEIPKVTYLDFDGGKLSEQTSECELVKAETTTLEAGKVYAVVRDVTIENRITVSGTSASPTKLVLCDGVTLAATKGVEVAAGKALVICGQALGTGTLEATGVESCAGIGGGGIVTINGGTVIATGGSSAAGIGGGTVTINGGTVTASGSDGAAGIGGTVKFGAGTAYGVAAGANEANALYKTAAAYAADNSAAYVALPCFSLKIPEAGEHYTYEVSYEGAQPKAVLAGQTNTYAIAKGATVRVRFTRDEDYQWETAPTENPMLIKGISGDTVVDAGDLPTVKFAKKGGEENPWTVGEGVTAYTNGTELVIRGAGRISDLSEIPAGVRGGLAAITVTESTVTGAASTAFKGFDGFVLTLPGGWQGEQPDAQGYWYGATGVKVKGSKDAPWTVGEGVTAYTNGTELVILGAGSISDLSEIPDDVKGGLAAITVAEPTVTGAASEAFSGLDGFVLTLSDGWQGELPDAGGSWYGATGVRIKGSKDAPWTVGEGVTAYTNGTELVILGAGTVADLSEIPTGVKTGIAAITVTEPTVTGAEDGVFAGFGDFVLTLPDNWQGELPDADGNWYGATVDMTAFVYPMAVKNVKFQQRYPWNGLVDVACDLSGEGMVTLKVTALTNGVEFVANPTLDGETTFDLGDGGATNGVKFVWDAVKDLPAGFKAGGVKVKVTVEK